LSPFGGGWGRTHAFQINFQKPIKIKKTATKLAAVFPIKTIAFSVQKVEPTNIEYSNNRKN
jgi:hypothetical protein